MHFGETLGTTFDPKKEKKEKETLGTCMTL